MSDSQSTLLVVVFVVAVAGILFSPGFMRSFRSGLNGEIKKPSPAQAKVMKKPVNWSFWWAIACLVLFAWMITFEKDQGSFLFFCGGPVLLMYLGGLVVIRFIRFFQG